MPYYSYRCTACAEEFEVLVRASDTDAPVCPKCGGGALERMLGAGAPVGKLAETLKGVRARAAKEGHFSNYSRREMKGKL